MGRRSRSRTSSPRTPKAARPAPGPSPAKARGGALGRLPPARRTLAIYLGCAMAVSVLTVLGIGILGGTLGPFIVLAYATLGGGLAYRWAQERLAGASLTDEDRVMQTLAGGLLAISFALAAISAVVLTATG